ncbi:glycosyltransferase family 61 protein [Paenibacillus macerans]|uniref:Glycosyltransferase 61 catalytic domain-containing protein n=1 Tax=Paenibacillus macerans TaxID=44252 RepID=A0A090ZC45_PAEMA|nr:glycosyltransferase family 61 protein [Paenibacillus macerans]KFN07790.1 hypothetical protein DJ90_3922 [Paenibacillus macerans]MCY7561611.1 glycosyltransferase family 61 protein [Paenibacillus macerans]MEC0153355.1 glycosyltransferase family 61 protein [Paenibacillus macerans]SUD25915.1 Capsular polysaccharide biosynthesis protein [Paenibacillus macerans]GBK65188.1 glycosyltransferase family 61 protein [Paenibacillus macerans]
MGKYVDLYVSKENIEAYRANEKQDYLRKAALNVKEVKNGIILPAKGDLSVSWALGGVLDENGQFVKESHTRNEHVFGGFYEYDKQSVQQCDETVVFMGPFLSHWGHFICDQISRLWYILPDIKKYRIAYCGWNWGGEQTSLWGNFLEFMHLLGLSDEQLIDVKKPMRFRSVIIPEFSYIQGEYYTEEFKNIYRTVVSNIEVSGLEPYSHIYFTRRKFSDALNKERGEDEIESLFAANGYKILSPEQLTLSQQIYYMRNCDYMAAISGSITHNLLFAKEGQKVIILNKMDLMNGYQMVIDNIMDVKISCVDVYVKIFPVCFGLGPFLIGINRNLKNFVKDKGMTIPRNLQLNIKATIKKYMWYFAKFARIYANEHNRSELLSQQSAVRKQKNK